jgi:hypothetical protein
MERKKSIISQRLEEIRALQERAASGRFNCIPFPLAKLSKIIPGIMRGMYYCVTANSGEGKTQFCKFLFVKSVLNFVKQNPDCGIKPHILYFAFEESKEDFIDSLVIDLLWDKYNIRIDHYKLDSARGPLPQDVLDKIAEITEEIEDIEKYITIIDSVSNPTGIYKFVKGFSRERGTHYYTELRKTERDRTFITEQAYLELEKTQRENWKYSHYSPNDPEEHILVIADHLSLMSPEAGAESTHLAMQKFSAEYVVMQIIKHFKYSVVAVHQQIMIGQDVEHKKAGQLKPDLPKLGDNKLIGRDYMVVLGIFSPFKNGIKKDLDYDIEKLKDYYVNLKIIKHRKGKQSIEMGLFFDGGARKFADLPDPHDTAKMNIVYDRVNYLETL